MQQQDAQNKQEMAKYNNQLALQRGDVEHQKQRERNTELVQLQASDHSHGQEVIDGSIGLLGLSWPT